MANVQRNVCEHMVLAATSTCSYARLNPSCRSEVLKKVALNTLLWQDWLNLAYEKVDDKFKP